MNTNIWRKFICLSHIIAKMRPMWKMRLLPLLMRHTIFRFSLMFMAITGAAVVIAIVLDVFFLFCFFVVAFFVQFAPFDGISAHYKWIPMSGRRKNNNKNAVYRYYGMLKLIKSNKTHKSNISSSSESNNNQCK